MTIDRPRLQAHRDDAVFMTLKEVIQTTAAQARFRPGDVVVIFQLGPFCCPKIEGLGTVVAPVPNEPGWYYILFEGEAQLRPRFVLPGVFQSEPERTLETLLTAWRAGMSPEQLKEFFVGDTSGINDNNHHHGEG